ncbi:hypothetical protein CRI93_13455 [Longimonas halophila]|uniref:Outer membrane protein beta-barrel domain-containing protein n=1 Tax=Longimonas halophila TaxID=1469170 RepID=A0A2H3NIF5_9BACT|nr:hypothetical protein CRI93_13455 [Longimonas halophila]
MHRLARLPMGSGRHEGPAHSQRQRDHYARISRVIAAFVLILPTPCPVVVRLLPALLRTLCAAGCLALVVLFPGALPSTGQSVSFGVVAGANIATVSPEPDLSTGFRTTVAAGGGMLVDLPGPVDLQQEVLFSQKGTAVTETFGQVNYTASYIEFPLQLRVALPSVWRLDLFATGGGSFGLKAFENQSSGSTLELQLPDEGSFFERTDASAVVGFGATFDEGPSPLSVFVRYMHGLREVSQGRTDVGPDIEENPFRDNPFPESAKTRTVTLGLMIGL